MDQPAQTETRKPLIAASNMSEAPSTRCLSSAEGYRLWSEVYDSQPNPMLLLEERFLQTLLPSLAGKDAVDLGCGTGRWLEKFVTRSPRSLVGLDLSAEMLARATAKLGGQARLSVRDCIDSTLPSACADLILCSFLASYISDLDLFAREIRRIARPCADIFLTDLHPATEAALGWRRGFRMDGAHVDFATFRWSLEQLRASFERAGLRPVAILEPRFGEPEFAVLERAGKLAASGALQNVPAIYIIQFRQGPEASSQTCAINDTSATLLSSISGARLAFGPDEATSAQIKIQRGQIEALGVEYERLSSSNSSSMRPLDLTGYLVFPGLVNAHDHLEFALFPRLGKGGYHNFSEWADDIHHPDSPPVREHRAIQKETRLWWGAIRNLMAGVTTVCHHNPYEARVFERDFPVRVLRDFGWAHSLVMDRQAASKYRDTPEDQPFILHLGEGIDAESAEELFALHRAGALRERTVVVHGLALNERGAALLKKSGAALIWCPSSNHFLFGKTHSREFIRELARVALGSDSSLTADGNLLDELRFAHSEVGVTPKTLFQQVTSSAAEILRLRQSEGSLRIGAVADFFAVRDRGLSPAETLASISHVDVELVVVGGRVHLASPELIEKLPPDLKEGLERLEVGEVVRWIRAPVKKLYDEAARVLGDRASLNGRPVRV